MFRSIPAVDRTFQLMSLPLFYARALRVRDCTKSWVAIAGDLLRLFFSYKTFPDHYLTCRLWEVDRKDWAFYYGSNYHPYQRARLKRKVQKEEYRILFKDKAVCEQLCRSMGISTPATYGTIGPDENYRDRLANWCRESCTGCLFLKPVQGRAGKGIMTAERTPGGVVVRSPAGRVALGEFDLAYECIVQEKVIQDRRMAVFSSESVNTVRVNTLLTEDESVILLGPFLRFGVGNSYVDNFSAGGIAVGIDPSSGRLRQYGADKKGVRYTRHPNADLVFVDFIVPEWDKIVETAVRVQKAFSFYRLLGLDIALKESGIPVVIEINSCPDLDEAESGPLLKDERILDAFSQYGLLINSHQELLLAGRRQLK